MKMTAFRNTASCSLLEVELRFRGAYCLHHQGDDGDSTYCETSVSTRLHGAISQNAVIFIN
jgi:hypothetical protein